jgi:site-specific recombinase XerD
MNIPKYIEQYRKDLKFKNYAENSIGNYVSQVLSFLNYFDVKFTEPCKINETAIKDWLMLAKTINSRKHQISAVKLFYIHTIKQPLKFRHIEYPRSEQKLPQPLSEAEVRLLFKHCDNLKHKAILSLLFMCGMRVGEVINLKPENIDRFNMVIKVVGGKGNKDRIVPMSEDLLKLLETYYRQYKPKEYMFNGQFTNQYSDRSVNEFMKQIGLKAGIKKNLHSHLGRHSCFSQMLSNGTDMAIIQRIAGHQSQKTTSIYAKVTSTIINKTTPYQNLF